MTHDLDLCIYYNVKYLLIVSCYFFLLDITIGFAMLSYTVNETTESVMLTITAEGDFPSPDLQSQLTVPVEATVLVNTDDIDAEGRHWYTTLQLLLRINYDTTVCFMQPL